MVGSHAAAEAVITEKGLPHAAVKAAKAAASETTEAATAAPRRIAGSPTHGYVLTREVAMVAIAKGLP
jgi:hypothetical protein